MAGFLADLLTGGNASASERSTKKAVDQMSGLQLPNIGDMQLQLQDLVSQGIISPEEAQTYLQESSQMANITLDPKLKQAQMDALSSLQGIANEGGLTAMDRARLNQIQTEEDTRARGAREAILQNAQARGVGGSGLELMAQLQNQQDAATRASNRGTDVAAQAQQRALEALMQAGNLGGNIAQQSFNQQATQAQAQDAINQFNTQNRQQVSNLNVGNRNQAQAANLAEKQRIADTNVGSANAQQQYNKQLLQQQFENEAKKRSGLASAYSNQAQAQQQAGQAITNLIGTGIGAAATAFGGPAGAALTKKKAVI